MPTPACRKTPLLLRSRSLILAERFLGLTDREHGSPTYGCCDRWHWCYRLHDLANARFQEAALFFALALPHAAKAHRSGLADVARACVRFWEGMRHADGSVDEVYPFERSFCATSMSAQAVLLAGQRLDVTPGGLTRTADWLAANANEELANQLAGACLSLFRIGRLLCEPRYEQAARDKLGIIVRRQLPSGSFEEYGGPDVGYATITLALLAQYAAESGNQDVLPPMRRCEAWLCSVVGLDGRYDWRATSRRTQFLYPSGLAWLGSAVLGRLALGLERNVAPSPLWLDDRYSIPLAADYLLAAELLESGSRAPCA